MYCIYFSLIHVLVSEWQFYFSVSQTYIFRWSSLAFVVALGWFAPACVAFRLAALFLSPGVSLHAVLQLLVHPLDLSHQGWRVGWLVVDTKVKLVVTRAF